MTQTLSKVLAAKAHRWDKRKRSDYKHKLEDALMKGRFERTHGKTINKEGKIVTRTESAKKGKWIQAASASIKKRGTAGVCTGDKFGGSTCPPGSKRYNLAKVFKGMAKKKKKAATGAMIHAKKSKYIQGTASTKDTLKNIDKILGVLPGGARDWKAWKKPAKKATGAMIHARGGQLANADNYRLHYKMATGNSGGILKAKTSAFAANPDAWKKARAASTTGMKVAGAGTAGAGWTTKINKNLNKLKNMMKLGTRTAATSGAINPSKWMKGAKNTSQLKTLAKTGGRRSLLLMGGPMGAAAAAATLTPGVINKLTKRAPGATKTKLFGIDLKGAEKSARTREALMAKRNKARNAKTGTMVKANVGTEVLGKQSVPFESPGATANLANERQGRKGAAVRGFNFKGVF